MKKKLSFLCLLCLMAFCCSCGKEEANNKQSEKSTGKKSDEVISTENESETEDESVKKPDEEKMRKDLEEKQCNTISFSEWEGTITVPIVNFTLDKAKDNEDSYVAYCTLELKDETYSGKITYALTYSYYDIGGWVLDEVKEENREIEAISYPQDQVVQEYIKKEDERQGELAVAEFTYCDKIENSGSWTFNLTKLCATEYVDYYYQDTIVCTFDCVKGWVFSDYHSEYYDEDWSRIVNTKWRCIEGSEEYIIAIDEYDIMLNRVIIDVSATSTSGWKLDGDYELIEDYEYIYSFSTLAEGDFLFLENPREWAPQSYLKSRFSINADNKNGIDCSFELYFSPFQGIECIFDDWDSNNITRIE